jgi:molybdopterin synthase sulfur carrier subunit
MIVQILYFSWVREKVGKSSEKVPTNASNVSELIIELCKKGENYKLAFSNLCEIKVALDQNMADFDSSLSGIIEVAFFPPMTGG